MFQEVIRFLRSSGISEGAFGWMAVNDPMLVEKLRRGRKIEPEMINRVRLWIANYEERLGGG